MKLTRKLRDLLAAPGVIQVAGVGDASQALLVESVGYPAVYMSGAYVNHTHGFPDGILTLTEISDRVGEIADRVKIPLIADADEGFGGVPKIVRTIREFEKAGAAGLHIEDMTTKKYGDPVPLPEAVNRLKAALDARRDPDFVIIARSDAMAFWRRGVDKDLAAYEHETFERSLAYAEAGADALLPMMASLDWLKRFGKRLPKPIVVLRPITPKFDPRLTPLALVPAPELEQYNVKMVIYATIMMVRAHAFMKKEFSDWLSAGRFVSTEQDNADKTEAFALSGGSVDFAALQAKYDKS